MTKEDLAGLIRLTVRETLVQLAERIPKPAARKAPIVGRKGVTPALAAWLETQTRVTTRDVLAVMGLPWTQPNAWVVGEFLAHQGWARRGRQAGPEGGPGRVWYYERRAP